MPTQVYNKGEIYFLKKMLVWSSRLSLVCTWLFATFSEGRLIIREDEDIKIVARDIKELTEVENKTKVLRIDITNLDEENKAKLRGMLKFFSGEQNNTPVQVVNKENILDCGSVYLNKDILEEFKELIGEEKVKLI